MLLTLVGALGGALINVIPTLIAYFIRREDTAQLKAKYEYELAKTKLEADVSIARQQMETDLVAESNERVAIDADVQRSDVGGFWSTVRTSIRPVITYSMFMCFIGLKGFAFYHSIFILNYDVLIALDYIWDPQTEAIFAAIVGFWFGSRAIEKFTR